MTKLGRRVEAVREEVRVHWTEERARRVERSLLLRQRRRRTLLRSTAATAALLLLLLLSSRTLLHSALDPRQPSPGASVTTPSEARLVARQTDDNLRLRDGSTVRLLDAASRVREQPGVGGSRIVSVDLERGGARFQVVRDPSRLFRVQAGMVITEVLGTEFTVERLGEQTRVSVESGRVRVLWPGGHTELGAGERGTFPPEPPVELPPVVVAEPSPSLDRAPAIEPTNRRLRLDEPPRKPLTKLELVDLPDWIALAQDGHFDSAYAALIKRGSDSVRGPAELLLAADVARLSHHPAAAVPLLRRVLREYSRDPRAPLAAFTLGRGLLDELGQPREAAEAFRTVQELDPDGLLAADALTREVEAWSRAGELHAARERALLYLRRYPDGDRQRAVRRYGGID